MLLFLLDRRRRRWNMALAILFLFTIVWILPFFNTRRIDHMLTYRVMTKVFASQQADLKAMGIFDLPTTEITYANEINTHAALREILIRRQKRGEHLQRLEANAAEHCGRSPTTTANIPSSATNHCRLPQYLLVPNIAGWSPMRPPDLLHHNLTAISFDEMEMKQLVDRAVAALNEHFGNDDASSLRSLYFQLLPLDRVHVWALAALFLYGGVFLGNVSPRGPTTNGSLSAHLAFIFDQIEKRPTAAFYAYSRDYTKHEPTELQSGTIELLAATAGNPVFAGLLQTVAMSGRSTTIGGATDGATSIVDILNTALLADTVSVTHDDLDWREASLSTQPVDNNGTKHRVHALCPRHQQIYIVLLTRTLFQMQQRSGQTTQCSCARSDAWRNTTQQHRQALLFSRGWKQRSIGPGPKRQDCKPCCAKTVASLGGCAIDA
jgi:hypothetical protein